MRIKNTKSIKCYGTIANIFPCHYPSTINDINGNPIPKTTTNWIKSHNFNHTINYNTSPSPTSTMSRENPNPRPLMPNISPQPSNQHPQTNPLTVSYTQITKSPNPPSIPQHYTHPPIWLHYLDTNPWHQLPIQQTLLSPQLLTNGSNPPSSLPLPPNPTDPRWRVDATTVSKKDTTKKIAKGRRECAPNVGREGTRQRIIFQNFLIL